jgi:pyridoxal phosphate enzyme (YggS family)
MIVKNLVNVKDSLIENVSLIAVSKTKPASDIQTLYNAGQRAFGENKVQELVEKYEVLPKDIEWHLIGHLQSNKVKYIAPFVHLIHGVDSFKLLKEINKEGVKCKRIIPCLLQFHIAQEETKFGFSFEEAQEMLESNEFVELQHVAIHGVMGMATFTEDKDQIHEEFQTLHNYFQLIKSHYFKFNPEFKELSMGMSGDYKIAMDEGSTMIRVGSTIFGSR